MGFLSGRITLEGYRIAGQQPAQFGAEHIEILERFAIGQVETSAPDEVQTGFLAGQHLFDRDFDLEKNVIADSLHFAMRIDTDQIPAAVRRAWLQMELASLQAESASGKLTKAQRQEAKDAVEARCEDEARSGRFRRMQQFPILWDARSGVLYFGGSSPTAARECCDLMGRAFDLELGRLTAGRRAQEWAAEAKKGKALASLGPAALHPDRSPAEINWWNQEAENFDYLGNEFLLWLWWQWETQSDTIGLSDGSEVTGMLARTLSLECPRGQSGKETITAESPVVLPEAVQAIRSGKLPRKAGLTLVRHGEQYEIVLQAETFAIGGARIQSEETSEGRGILEDRIESVRGLNETVGLLFQAFCAQRIGKGWAADLGQITGWLKKGKRAAR